MCGSRYTVWLAGYEDVNDAERLSQHPAFGLIGSEKVLERGAPLTSRLQSFETEPLTQSGLLSDEHFTVDGTLIEAWAGHKSFKRKDQSDTKTPPDDPGKAVAVPTADRLHTVITLAHESGLTKV